MPPLYRLIPLLLCSACSLSPPLAPQQVVSRDAYQNAEQWVQRNPIPFVPVSAAQRARQQGRTLSVSRGLILIDDGGSMAEFLPQMGRTRAQLAVLLAERLQHTAVLDASPLEQAQLRTLRVTAFETQRLATALEQLSSQFLVARMPLWILSRQQRLDAATQATMHQLHQRHPALCVHLITVGDAGTSIVLKRRDSCDTAVRDQDLIEAPAMAAYLVERLYSGPRDGDSDGVLDRQDLCPHTPPGQRINWDGCSFDLPALTALVETMPTPTLDRIVFYPGSLRLGTLDRRRLATLAARLKPGARLYLTGLASEEESEAPRRLAEQRSMRVQQALIEAGAPVQALTMHTPQIGASGAVELFLLEAPR